MDDIQAIDEFIIMSYRQMQCFLYLRKVSHITLIHYCLK